MEVGPEVEELLAKIKSVPPFLGSHYFCRHGCEDFVREFGDAVWLAKHWRLLKERDYVTYKYVVVPYLSTLLNYGNLIAKMMEMDKVYLALIWGELADDIRRIFKDMMQSKEGHRQCNLGGRAALSVNRYGDAVVEYGYCRKEIPFTYRRGPGEELRKYLRSRYCPDAADGDSLTCDIDAGAVPEVIAVIATWPKVQYGELFKGALGVVRPLLDAVVKSDRWRAGFLLDAVDAAMRLLSVEYGLSGFDIIGLLSRIEGLGLRPIFILEMALADMEADCVSRQCYFGRGESAKRVRLECPVEEATVIAPLNVLYKEDPVFVYNFLKPYIEEGLFKKKQ